MEKYDFFKTLTKQMDAAENIAPDSFIAKSIRKEDSLIIDYSKTASMQKADNLYSAKVLRCRIATDLTRIPETVLGCYMVDDGNLIKLKKVVKGCYIVYYDILSDYINLTGKNAVQTFLEELIADTKPFRNVIVSNSIFPSQILWSKTIKREYEEKYHEPIADKLALLFVDAKGSTRFKSRYFTLLHDLVSQNFLSPLKNLTYANKAELCGEMNCVLSPISQVLPNVSLMAFAGGFDRIILRCPKELADSDFIKKNAGILTNINRQKTVATISYSDFLSMSLDELKRLVDRLFANNIIRICIECPAEISGIAAEKYNQICAHIKRLASALYMGQRMCDIMFLYPALASFSEYTPIDTSRIVNYNATIEKELFKLCKNNIPFDVGFEQALGDKIVCEGAILSVGENIYSKLVLPSAATVSYNTANFLIEFASKGGRVYTLGEKPHLIDGVKSERIDKLQSIIRTLKDDELSSLRPAYIPVMSDYSVDVRVSKLADASIMYFFANIRPTEKNPTATIFTYDDIVNVDIINTAERAAILSNKTGKITGRNIVKMDYYEHGNSTFFRIVKNASYENLRQNHKLLPLDDVFKIRQVTKNTLRLTECEWRLGRGKWQAATPVYKAIETLTKKGKDTSAQFKFSFSVSMGFLTKAVALFCECGKFFDIAVNGNMVDFSNQSTVNITDYIKLGKNEILLTTLDSEALKTQSQILNNIYLSGDFALKNSEEYTYSDGKILTNGSFTLISQPDSINSYKLRENGYWFFDGSIELSQTLLLEKKEKGIYKIAFRKIWSVYAEVTVNGVYAGILAFAPYEIDVSDLIFEGENEICVKFHSLFKEGIETVGNQLCFEPFGGRLRDKEHSFINCEDVVKHYRDADREIALINGISFGIERGEFVVIAAPDGSGKTTLLNILAGNERYDAGRVKVDGDDLGEMNMVALNNYRKNAAAYILSGTNLIDTMTVLENITMAEDKKLIKDVLPILESVGVEALINKFPYELSVYDKQRVALARALSRDVKFILCDEPFGLLDYNAGNELLCLLKSVCKSTGKTIIIATNNFAVCFAADRVIKLKNGKISANTVNEKPAGPEGIEW